MREPSWLSAGFQQKLCSPKQSGVTYSTHIYGIYKDGNDNPVCETAKETQMYRIVFWTLWERERVGWFGRMALKRKLSYVKWIASPGLMHDIGCSGLVHWDDPGGWDGEGGGRGVQDGEHMYTHGRSMSMYGKTSTMLPSLKKKKNSQAKEVSQ